MTTSTSTAADPNLAFSLYPADLDIRLLTGSTEPVREWEFPGNERVSLVYSKVHQEPVFLLNAPQRQQRLIRGVFIQDENGTYLGKSAKKSLGLASQFLEDPTLRRGASGELSLFFHYESTPSQLDPEVNLSPFRWSVCVIDSDRSFEVVIEQAGNAARRLSFDPRHGIELSELGPIPEYRVRSAVHTFHPKDVEKYVTKLETGKASWALFFKQTRNLFPQGAYPFSLKGRRGEVAHFWVKDDFLISHQGDREREFWCSVGEDLRVKPVGAKILSIPEEERGFFLPRLCDLKLESLECSQLGNQLVFAPRYRALGGRRECQSELADFWVRFGEEGLVAWDTFFENQVENLRGTDRNKYLLLNHKLNGLLGPMPDVGLPPGTPVERALLIDAKGDAIEKRWEPGEKTAARNLLEPIAMDQVDGEYREIFLRKRAQSIVFPSLQYQPFKEVFISVLEGEEGVYLVIEGLPLPLWGEGYSDGSVELGMLDRKDLQEDINSLCQGGRRTVLGKWPIEQFEEFVNERFINGVYEGNMQALLGELLDGAPLIFVEPNEPPLDPAELAIWKKKRPLQALFGRSYTWFVGGHEISYRFEENAHVWRQNGEILEKPPKFYDEKNRRVELPFYDVDFVPILDCVKLRYSKSRKKLVFAVKSCKSSVDNETLVTPCAWNITLTTRGSSQEDNPDAVMQPHTKLFLQTPDSENVTVIHLTFAGLVTQVFSKEVAQGDIIRRSQVFEVFPSRQFIEKILRDIDKDLRLERSKNCSWYGHRVLRRAGIEFCDNGVIRWFTNLHPYADTAPHRVGRSDFPEAIVTKRVLFGRANGNTLVIKEQSDGENFRYFGYLNGDKKAVFRLTGGFRHEFTCTPGEHCFRLQPAVVVQLWLFGEIRKKRKVREIQYGRK